MQIRKLLKSCVKQLGFAPVRLGDLARSKKWHLTPVHYYHPIPDTRRLRESLWTTRSQMVGVDLNLARQFELLEEFKAQYAQEYDAWPDTATDCAHEFYFDQQVFRSVDAEVLYSMIRKFRPRRMIEIGAGMSTMVAAAAVRKNQTLDGSDCQLTAIEPYPSDLLRQGFPGLAELVATPVEDVPLEKFTELQENDILFIDSSHIIKIGGDVLYEFLEVIPRLRPGVLVHVHDVFLPANYPKAWITENHWFWTEQYLLHAFLCFNDAFEVLWSGSYLHIHHPDRLAAAFRSYKAGKELPGSFWIRRKTR